MRVMRAVALVTHVMHQPLPTVKAMPLRELYTWATVSAAIIGQEF